MKIITCYGITFVFYKMVGFIWYSIMKIRQSAMLWLCCVIIINFTACGKSQGKKERDNYFVSQCTNVDSIWHYFSVENDPVEYISMICNAQSTLGKRGLTDSSLKLLKRMDQFASELKSPKVFTYVYLNRAFDAMINGQLDSAQRYYNMRRQYVSGADDINVLMAYQYAGNYYYLNGQIDSAREEFVNGYKYSRVKGDSAMMYNFALNAGTTYFDLQLTSMAKYYFSEAYVMGSKKGKVSLMLINNLVATLISESKYSEAIKLCEDNQSNWMSDSTNNGSTLLKINYAYLLNQQGEFKRSESVLKLVRFKSIPRIHLPYYYSNLLESMLGQNKKSELTKTLLDMTPFIYQNQPRSVVEMKFIIQKAVDQKLFDLNLDSLTAIYDKELKSGSDYYSSTMYCELIADLLEIKGNKSGSEIWKNRSIGYQLDLSKAKDSLQVQDLENQIAQAELSYRLSTKQRVMEEESVKNRLILIGLLSSLVIIATLIFALRLKMRNRKKRSQIFELETAIKENEILTLQKEKELKEKTITLAKSVLLQVSKLSDKIKNSSFSRDPDALMLKQELDRLSELSTSVSETDVQNDVAYSDFDFLFEKIPSLATLNQTERRILILTVIGSKPKEIGAVLNLNDQYIRNVKSKIKKLLPEEFQNQEWEELKSLN